MKIAVAMSGGVDSSVAAALCVERYGKEHVFGVTMRLFCYGEAEADDKSCCSLSAVNDAKQVCDQLGIAHYALNLEKEFEMDVINDFVREYQEGQTPNPCIRCNEIIKFEKLLERVQGLGAELLVTGHYARVKKIGNEYKLFKGVDEAKDQSYFLYNLNQEQLMHVDFPLGKMRKPETRKLATKLGLKTAQKTESQDICFVTSTLKEFLGPRVKFKEGNIVDKGGKVLGKHEGLPFYTIGQRKGLGGGFNEPMFVIGVNIVNNELIVGTESELFSKELVINQPHWIKGNEPEMPLECTAKIRYQAKEAECSVSYNPERSEGSHKTGEDFSTTHQHDSIRVTFKEPQKAITPGQSCVFYKDEEVIGGGVISA